MATNEVQRPAWNIKVTATDPTTPASGDPVLCGAGFGGVALEDEDTDGTTIIATEGVFNLSVKGVNSSGNAAITQYDKLYYKSGDTPVINADDTGVFFGYAMSGVGSGATATIGVKLAHA